MGTESAILNCLTHLHQPPGFHECGHSQDVAIGCTGKWYIERVYIYLCDYQTLMNVLMIMEDVIRPVPTLLGATSAVVRVDMFSIKMRGDVMVSLYSHKCLLLNIYYFFLIFHAQTLMSVCLTLHLVIVKMVCVLTLLVDSIAPVVLALLEMDSIALVRKYA